MQYNITYRKKDGGWQYIISFKENGKWKQRSKQGFRTRGLAKVAADKRLDELKKSFKADLSIENKGITFYEFKEKYLNDLKKYREGNTVKAYKQTFEYFNKLNDILMTDITYLDIQKCVDDMIENPTLKLSTIKLYVSRVKTLFDKATRKPYKVLAKTPLDEDVELPDEKEQDKKIRALTKTELDKVLNTIEPEKDYIICLIASTCGLRVGEILGLTWNDIDEKNKKMNVNKQWKRLKDGTIGLGTVKRRNSNRVIPIPEKTLKELLKYKKNNPTDIYNRVILDKNGDNVSRRIITKLNKNGRNITIHDLRHTYATTLISKGVDFKTVAQFMGHDVEQTIKTYSHVTDDMIQNATNVLNSIFN